MNSTAAPVRRIPQFLARTAPALAPPADEEDCFGFSMPLDRYYHRGHTWVNG